MKLVKLFSRALLKCLQMFRTFPMSLIGPDIQFFGSKKWFVREQNRSYYKRLTNWFPPSPVRARSSESGRSDQHHSNFFPCLPSIYFSIYVGLSVKKQPFCHSEKHFFRTVSLVCWSQLFQFCSRDYCTATKSLRTKIEKRNKRPYRLHLRHLILSHRRISFCPWTCGIPVRLWSPDMSQARIRE